MRTFVAINLPERVKAEIARRQRVLAAAPGGQAVRWIGDAQAHLTLRFLGDVPCEATPEIEAALRKAVAGVAPFELRLAGWGCFPGTGRPCVYWIGLEGALEVLGRLQAAVADRTRPWGKLEDRRFTPHLTVGRVKLDEARRASRLVESLGLDAARPSACWRVEEVALMRSTLRPGGAEHAVLACVPLTGGERPGTGAAA
ncbi:MAG: RNA 2',3'-cyclic phosphodiesterase [Verrucomicrobia bacterium]|nr:RNA 2',3'-cyclic phosphodiesterase [Verrucomicrobiota bacterium]